MIRPLAGLLLWLLWLPAAWAAQEEGDGLPLSLIAHLADTEYLEGNFEQVRHVAVLAVPLRSSGTFRYQRVEGITWRTTAPLAGEVRVTPRDGVVAVDEAGNIRPIPATETVAGIFLGIFSGDTERLAAYFALAPEPRSDGWSLRLTPLLPGMASQIDSILVEGGDHVDHVDIREANGDRSELTLRVTARREAGR
ncbi:MAG: outer membrane lipoprotein carrier protein LolA [Porticoccaceae bacterium]